MPRDPQRWGKRRCFLTAPSSTWNALLDVAGRLHPANVHAGIHANLDCKCKQTRDKQQQVFKSWNKDLIFRFRTSEFMTACRNEPHLEKSMKKIEKKDEKAVNEMKRRPRRFPFHFSHRVFLEVKYALMKIWLIGQLCLFHNCDLLPLHSWIA